MRKLALGLLLLATFYLVYESSRQDEEAVVVSEPLRSGAPVVPAEVTGKPSALAGRNWQEAATGNPFRTMQWYTPPKVQPEPPPKPVAPPLPYLYFGKLAEGDELQAFLQKGTALKIVKAGDMLDSNYRVESITAKAVTFVYLPLNTVQVAMIGARSVPAMPLAEGMPMDNPGSQQGNTVKASPSANGEEGLKDAAAATENPQDQ